MKKYVKGNIYNGFRLTEEEFVTDIKSNVQIFEHEKTGAKLMYVGNEDDNKVFDITFKTLPKNDTGVMHILEHSVLCGSKKYPVKSPLIEICKGSLNTFINAYTASDNTSYPIASKNDKDYFNLMNVYLDAVFNPNLVKTEKIFKQEGWHYHIENKEDDIEYKGVVYNEMKGASASAISQLYQKSSTSLFPDNTYTCNSSGDPKEILNLTYEEYLETYNKFYHPSNSYIYLYGNLDLDKALELLDKEYLSNYERKVIDTTIPLQKPFDKMQHFSMQHEVSSEENLENSTNIALNFCIDKIDNYELSLAIKILNKILLTSDECPLKRAILNAGLGEDVWPYYDSSIQQPSLSIIIENTSSNKKEQLLKVFKDTLEDLCSKGINKKLISGCINQQEFALRECYDSKHPKGLLLGFEAISSWIHGSNPIDALKYEENLSRIKDSLDKTYFEEIIQKYILNNPHSSVVVSEPSLEINTKETTEMTNRLRDFKKGLSDNELDALITETHELLNYQQEEDTAEALATIPHLSVKDIPESVEDFTTTPYLINDIDVQHYNIFTGGIVYTKALFELHSLDCEDIPYIGLLSNLLGRLGTSNTSYVDFSNQILGAMSKFNAQCNCSRKYNVADSFSYYLVCSFKTLESNIDEAYKITNRILTETSFEDKKRIKEIIQESILNIEASIQHACHLEAMNTVMSSCNKGNMFINKTHRTADNLAFLRNLIKNFDDEIPKVQKKLSELAKHIFSKENLKIFVISSNEGMEKSKTAIEKSLGSLSYRTDITKMPLKIDVVKQNTGISIPIDVQFVASGYDYLELGYKYNPYLPALNNLLSNGFLWNKIRVQGGAYGALFNVNELGDFVLCSYRDPNLKNTLKVYDEIADYIENLELSESELEKVIIGAISETEIANNPYDKGWKALSYHMSGLTTEIRQANKINLLNTTVQSIRDLAPMMREIVSKNNICVVGNSNKISDSKEIFDEIINPLSK